MVPLLGPCAVGVKVTLMAQELLAATLPAQVFVWEKSPLAVMLVMASVAVPVFLSMTGSGMLDVPTN